MSSHTSQPGMPVKYSMRQHRYATIELAKREHPGLKKQLDALKYQGPKDIYTAIAQVVMAAKAEQIPTAKTPTVGPFTKHTEQQSLADQLRQLFNR